MITQYVFGPLERRGIFLGLRGGQLAVGLGATAGVIGILTVSPTAVGAVTALALMVLGAGAATVPVVGRTLEQWCPLILHYCFDEAFGDHRWIGRSNLRGHELLRAAWTGVEVADPAPRLSPSSGLDGRRTRRRDSAEGDAPPGDRWVDSVRRLDSGDPPPPYLRGLELWAARWREGDIGIIKDVRTRTYLAVIAARGRSFSLVDGDERERMITQWGAVLASAARDAGAITRLQWLERTVPDDSEGVVRHLQERRALPASSAFVASYLALLDDAAPQTQQHEVFVVVQVGAARAAGAIRRLGRGLDTGASEILSRELDVIAGGLQRAEVDVRGVLSPRVLAATLRQAVDPSSREQLAHRAAANTEVTGASCRDPWPRRSMASWSALRTEGAWHATYWVSEWPRCPVGDDWMTPLLLGTRSRRSVSVVMEPLPPTIALRRVEAARIDDTTTRSLRDRFGFRQTARRRREEEGAARAEEELNEGHQQYALSAYVTVSASTSEELEMACADIEQQARQARLDVRREYGAQDVAFTYTLPLCRGLR